MARNVGGVEITVDADTSKLKAQIIRGAREAGKAAQHEIDEELGDVKGQKLFKRLGELREGAERIMAGITVDFDVEDERLKADLRALRGELRNLELEVRLDPEFDDTDLGATLAEMRLLAKDIEVNLDPEVDNVELLQAIAVIQGTIDSAVHAVQVGAEIDAASVIAAREKLEAIFTAIKPDIDLRRLIAKLTALRETVERAVSNIVVDFDVENERLAGDLAALRASLRDFEIKARVELERDDVADVLSELRVLLRDVTVRVDAEANPAAALAAGEVINSVVASVVEAVKLGAEVVTPEFLAAGAEINAILGTVEVEITSDPLWAKIEADRLAMEVLFHKITAEIDVDIDRASKAKADALLKSNMEKTGHEAGLGFGRNLISGDNTVLIIAAALTLGQALAEGLQGSLAAATSVVSSAFSAIGAAALSAAPIVAGLGTALGTVVIGSQGVGDAIKEVNKEFTAAASEGRAVNLSVGTVGEALRKLSPEARDTVLAFQDMRDELDTLKSVVQSNLFEGMDENLSRIASTVLPDIADGLAITSRSVNEFGDQLVQLAEETDFSHLFESLDPALDDVFDAITAVLGTIEPFLEAAAPAAERLAEMLRRGAEALRSWVENNPQAIADFLDRGLTSLRLWAELLQSTGDLLGTIFRAGQEAGDGFVSSLNRMVERWDAFLESTKGQESLKKFFDSGKAAMDAFKPVLEGLKDAFATLVTDDALGNFRELGQAIGNALPALAELISLTSELDLIGAFSGLLQIVGPLFDLLNSLPAPVLEFVGAMTLITVVGAKVITVIRGIGTAFSGLGKTNAVLAGIGLAMSVAITAFETFSNSNAEAEAASKSFADQLANTADAIIHSGEVAAGADVAHKAFQDTLRDTEGGKKLITVLGEVNKGIEDAEGFLVGFSNNGKAALSDLAQSFGLPAAEADILAQKVLDTDDNFQEGSIHLVAFNDDLDAMSKRTGISSEKLTLLIRALAEARDQGENLAPTLEQVAQSAIDLARGGTEIEKAQLAQAEAFAASQGKAGDLLTIYGELLVIQNTYANSTSASTEANSRLIASWGEAEAAMYGAQIAAFDLNEELRKSRDEALKAFRAQQDLAKASEDVARAIGRANFGDAADEIFVLGEKAKTAAGKADALKASLDLLFGGFVTEQEAISSTQQAMDDFTEAISGGTEAAKLREEAWTTMAETTDETRAKDEEHTRVLLEQADALDKQADTLDLSTQAGRDNFAILSQWAGGIKDTTVAQLALGKSGEEVKANFDASREALIAGIQPLFESREAAAAYADQLVGIPRIIDIAIQNPGLVDALINAQDLKLIYDEVGNLVLTPELKALGVTEEMVRSQEFKTLLEAIGAETVEPEVRLQQIEESRVAAEKLQQGLQILGEFKANPDVQLLNAGDVAKQLTDLGLKISETGELVADPTITADTTAADTALQGTTQALKDIQDVTARPEVLVEGADTSAGVILGVATDMAAIDSLTATPAVQVETGTSEGDILGVAAAMGGLEAVTATPVVQVETGTSEGEIAGVAAAMSTADAAIATPLVQVETGTSQGEIDAVAAAMGGLNTLTGTPTVGIAGAEGAVATAQNLGNTVTGLNAVTGTPTVGIAGAEGAVGTAQGVGTAVSGLNAVNGTPTIGIAGAEGAVQTAQGVTDAMTNLDQVVANPSVQLIDNVITLIVIGQIKKALDEVSNTKAVPTVSIPTAPGVRDQISGLQDGLNTLGGTKAHPSVTLDGYSTAKSNIDTLQDALGRLGRSSASPSVTANVGGAISNIGSVQNALAGLHDKTVTVTVQTNNIPGGMNGMILPGSMAGELIRGPSMRAVGERGYAEAIIPLQLPLNRVDPTVRQLAALLRGENGKHGLAPGGIGKQVINNMTITPQAADPVAVAQQVINRSVALATR